MKRAGWLTTLLLLVILATGCEMRGVHTSAQVGVAVGPEPVCPYGYFPFPPYDCAPYGYYGPEWFINGVFIGAGPWFHGHDRFWGHVDRHFDPRHGYHGEFPHRGEHPVRPLDHVENFRGSELHDGYGHVRRH